MSTAETLRAALLAYPSLVSLVGGRIRPQIGKPSDVYPLVVFKRIGLNPTFSLNNELIDQSDTFQVEAWGLTNDQASDVAEEVMHALVLAGMPPESGDPDSIDPDEGVYAAVWNVEVWKD